MAHKYFRVTLTDEERRWLSARIAAWRAAAQNLSHARIILKADEGPLGPRWTDQQIVQALEWGRSTVERVRRRFVEEGIEAAISRRAPRRIYRRKLEGEQEAHLVALACSPPPLGRRQWSLRLLADKLVELRFIDGVSYETVRQPLKNTPS